MAIKLVQIIWAGSNSYLKKTLVTLTGQEFRIYQYVCTLDNKFPAHRHKQLFHESMQNFMTRANPYQSIGHLRI